MSLQAMRLETNKKEKRRSGGHAALQADLHRDSSIVCLYVCSSPCQAAGEIEAWAESLPHKGHSLSPLLVLGCRSTVGRLLPACVGRTTLYHLLVWIDSSLWCSLVCVCHRPSQHMFDSDQMFAVCVEPPTQRSEGQLYQINTYQF